MTMRVVLPMSMRRLMTKSLRLHLSMPVGMIGMAVRVL